MGHKVNPDIFRLGVSKKWSYQLRTNKNFIKNLFIFKLLKNLFINYNIPLFTWKKHRNRKINDRLILRGEKQIAISPIAKKNILFSHVYFGLLQDEIFIESFFIEVNINQTRKKNAIPSNPLGFAKKEYQHWQPGYYKRKILLKIQTKKKPKKAKFRRYLNNLKIMFNSVSFRKISRKSKLFVIKPVRVLSEDFYYFSANYDYKHSHNLRTFFSKKLRTIKKKKLSKFQLAKKYTDLYYRFLFHKHKRLDLYFNIRKQRKFVARLRRGKAVRYLRTKKYYRVKITPNYKKYNEMSSLRKKKIFTLTKKRGSAIAKLFLKKIGLPKSPLRVYNLIYKKIFNYRKLYHSLSLLKYFIRSIKYFKFFGIKKRIFFCHNLINIVIGFMNFGKYNVIGKKLFVLIQGLMYYSYSLSFWNFVNMKKKYLSNYILYKAVSKTLFRSLIELLKIKKLTFNVTSQNKYKFGSSLVLNYILIKLGQYFMINEIVNPLSFFIKGLTAIAGYKIFIRGRLTRRERATVMVRSGKKMPLSTISANIDYCQGSKIMKFGMVGIKVYLLLKSTGIVNLYKFTFKYAKVS